MSSDSLVDLCQTPCERRRYHFFMLKTVEDKESLCESSPTERHPKATRQAPNTCGAQDAVLAFWKARGSIVYKHAAGLAFEVATDFTNIDGMGAQATVTGARVLLGNRKLMDANHVDINGLQSESGRLQGAGRTVVHVAHGGKLIGLIAIADAPRPTSAATIKALHERGVEVAMLTGDNRATAERIAKELGIDIVLADVLPGEKATKVKELQAQGKKVGMVGDGINDAPALTQADVGFAIGAGTDVATESADVVLMKSDPFDVVGAVELSRATLRKMHQNLWWAVGYNVVAFPIAAGVFYPLTISPEIAALAMSGSSALVAINALMLKRTRLAGIHASAFSAIGTGPTGAHQEGIRHA